MGEPLAVEDLVEDRRLDPAHMQRAVELGFHGFLGVPLTLHGRVIGALDVYTKQRRAFTPDDVNLLSALADQASVAITKKPRRSSATRRWKKYSAWRSSPHYSRTHHALPAGG